MFSWLGAPILAFKHLSDDMWVSSTMLRVRVRDTYQNSPVILQHPIITGVVSVDLSFHTQGRMKRESEKL